MGGPAPEPHDAPTQTTPPAPAPGTPPGQPSQPGGEGTTKSKTENLKVIGGLLALVAGLLVLAAIVLAAIFALGGSEAGAAVTGGITAIGSMVGAYFGVKVGSDGTKEAVQGQKEEATKAQAFALGVAPANRKDVLDALERMTGKRGGLDQTAAESQSSTSRQG